jgi:hypothetical protein
MGQGCIGLALLAVEMVWRGYLEDRRDNGRWR